MRESGPPRPGRAPAASACEPYRELIATALERGRNAVAIYQDLVTLHGFEAKYASVKRFVRKLRGTRSPEPCGVIVTAPGEEAQVYYGEGPMIRDPVSGKYRRADRGTLVDACTHSCAVSGMQVSPPGDGAELSGRRRGRKQSAPGSQAHGRSTRRPRVRSSTDLLAVVFQSPRAVHRSYLAYLRYRDHGRRKRDLEEAFLGALPVVRDVCRSRDRALGGASAWSIFRAFQDRRFGEGNVSRYWTYLRQIARGAIAHEREASDRFRLVDHVSSDVCWDGMRVTGRLVGMDDVERELVIEKIPILVVVQDVVNNLRFAGEDRDDPDLVLEPANRGGEENSLANYCIDAIRNQQNHSAAVFGVGRAAAE